ncbi:hypothetical protein DSM104299_02652 [Baekduia alba]|uniref:PKD domain-containing protein n=1 Tax=Baekduia alba TaxID=2997333 RepID=UPI0023421563|nr:PKD domain-containing protein [Baekduia alba]WCB93926.1 hypothetical protein DSM104299_02652 [Baekduia alba]
MSPRVARLLALLVLAVAGVAPAVAHADPPPGETARVLAPLGAAGPGGGVGVDVRPAGGAPVVSSGADAQYEPASSVKVLYGVAAERRVVAGQATFAGAIKAYKYPDSPNANGNPSSPTLCPVASDEVAANARTGITLGGAEQGMLVHSDNTLTRAILLAGGGLGPINAVATAAGMTSTALHQDFIGCAYRGGKRNVTTLADMSRFYAALDAGRLVAAAGRDHLYATMLHGTYSTASDFGKMVADEAQKLGLPSSVVIPFLDQAWFAQKGGSYASPCGGPYGQPPACGSSTDTTRYATDMSLTELQRIPFMRLDGSIDLRTYTSGAYVFDRLCTTDACVDGAQSAVATAASVEGLRSVVHDALLSRLVAADAPPVARFGAPPAGVATGAAVAFDASGSSDADGPIAHYAWDFGDGSTAQGATAAHAYATPGTRTVTLTVTDALGRTGTATQTVSVVLASAAAADTKPPTLRVRSAHKVRARRALTLKLTLSEPATVSVTVTHASAGRRKGSRCVAPPKARHGRACKRTVVALRTTVKNRKSGSLRLRGIAKLRPGRYRLTISAHDAAGNAARPVRITLTVARARTRR